MKMCHDQKDWYSLTLFIAVEKLVIVTCRFFRKPLFALRIVNCKGIGNQKVIITLCSAIITSFALQKNLILSNLI